MNEPRTHNYEKKLQKLFAAGKIKSPSLLLVDIYHDHWCAFNRGGYCNCDPDITPLLPVERN